VTDQILTLFLEWKGRNPAAGEDMMVVPRRISTFRCSRKLRDRMNEQRQRAFRSEHVDVNLFWCYEIIHIERE
jgi:hypothetical protein